MIAIRHEIAEVESGEVAWPTACCATPRTRPRPLAGKWEYPYERSPRPSRSGSTAADKYWPPVARIDGAYGDRNLVCSCPPPEAFES